MESSDSLHQLFKKYLDNQCSPREVNILLGHFKTGKDETLLKALIRQEFENNNPDVVINASSLQSMLDETYQNIRQQIQKEQKYKTGVVGLIRKQWLQYAAAAAVLTTVLLSAYYIFSNRSSGSGIAVNNKKQPQVQDVAPPSATTAVLTLDNGTKIVLDSAHNGSLAMQGDVKVIKLADGEISYNGAANSNEVRYNTLTVPRGSQVVSLTLTDGTRVWMNAESSLRYPTAFVGKERTVEITGEAYFEVSHSRMPFKVKDGDAAVEVLGTHFNINAYEDENKTRVTLLEGSVKVKNGNEFITIKPNEQAEINKQGRIDLNKNVDVEEVIAWKNGLFVFNSTDLGTIMRQIGRWYDVGVQYSGSAPEEKHYSGYVPRLVNLSRVLHMMESAGGVEFAIDGKKIMVRVK